MEPDTMILYADCHHTRRQKLHDWLRFRRHPGSHLISYSKLYRAGVGALTSNPLDLDQDTIKVALTADGTFTIEEAD